jgi:hypothetical protein
MMQCCSPGLGTRGAAERELKSPAFATRPPALGSRSARQAEAALRGGLALAAASDFPLSNYAASSQNWQTLVRRRRSAPMAKGPFSSDSLKKPCARFSDAAVKQQLGGVRLLDSSD